MTRKHVKAIAAIIAEKGCYSEPGNERDMVIKHIAEDLADYFASENQNFDRERFLKACGIG